jgi:hypothetical protein
MNQKLIESYHFILTKIWSKKYLILHAWNCEYTFYYENIKCKTKSYFSVAYCITINDVNEHDFQNIIYNEIFSIKRIFN